MSEHRPEVERLLRAEMERQAEGDDAAPVPADVVRRRALRLQRRRRGASAAGAVLAVAAIAVPLVVLGTRGGGAAPQPAPDPTTSEPASPSPTASTATDERDSVRDWVDGLPAGRAPRIGYVAGRTYVEPDGTERQVGYPNPLQSFVPYRGGLLAALGYYEGAVQLLTLDASLSVTAEACSQGDPAPSADGRRVYWSTGFCPESLEQDPPQIVSASSTGSEEPLVQDVQRAPSQFVSMLGPLTADSDTAPVAYALSEPGGTSTGAGVWVTSFGGQPRRLPGLRFGSDASTTGLVFGSPRRSGNGGIVVDATTGRVLWQTNAPLYGSARFSPDGAYLLAPTGIYDAETGELVTALDIRGAALSPVWEDATHVLVGVRARRDVAVVRVDVADGTMERAVDWRRASVDGLPGEIGFEVLP